MHTTCALLATLERERVWPIGSVRVSPELMLFPPHCSRACRILDTCALERPSASPATTRCSMTAAEDSSSATEEEDRAPSRACGRAVREGSRACGGWGAVCGGAGEPCVGG